ncbi:hypothetical protein [Salibacter halophilus]|uniref:Uncharacterized protein n=1 Tax=Salibacter halophilus TaxID=1803916 RepID=A0A6N6MAT9_9FLAO|nr:hypothetical protein [Salibacter halophilus]KAB1066109.1 hypothetical protein F3059_01165 [Salibacter halophilus]
MKAKYLFSHKWKPIGLTLFIIGLTLGTIGVLSSYEPVFLDVRVPDFFGNSSFLNNGSSSETGWPQMRKNNLFDEIALSLLLIGGLLSILAKEKNEDEMIMKLRLESLLWSAIVNGILIFITVWLIYDLDFYFVMITELFFFYLLFILRFNFVLMRQKKLVDEE